MARKRKLSPRVEKLSKAILALTARERRELEVWLSKQPWSLLGVSERELIEYMAAERVRLPPKRHRDREIVRLRYEEGRTCKEIGDLMGMETRTVQKVLQRQREL